MKSLFVTLATSTVLSAAVLAAGQTLSVAGAGMILFAAGVVSFAFADYARKPRLALRPIARASRAARPVAAPARVADYSATITFNTIAA